MDQVDTLSMNWRSTAYAMLAFSALIPQIYLWSKGIERRATLWLAGFVLAAGVHFIPMIIGFAGAYDIWPGLTFLPVSMMLFVGPLLYLHARQLMMGIVPARYYLLLVPGILNWLYELWAFIFLGDYRAKWAFNDAFHQPFVVPLVMTVSIVLGIWAFVRIWQMRLRYLEWLEANRSDSDDFNPRWISHFLVIGAAMIALWAVTSIFAAALGWNYFEQSWWDLMVLFLIVLLSLEALARLDQPFPKMLAPDAISVEELMAAVSEERDWVREGERLRAMVTDNGWHLESSLSLQTLSRRFGMNQAYVSRALNQGLDLSFSQFINGLRVEHAKAMITREDVNLLDVALSSGFGSKASFNRAFKLHTGSSPSEFKRLNS